MTQGLSAPTAGIAKEAGVANGSPFTYFEMKTDLFNQLYVELKSETTTIAIKGLPKRADLRNQMFHVWRDWTKWAVSSPERGEHGATLCFRRNYPRNRATGHKMMAGLAELLEHSHASGSMRRAPLAFVLSLTNSLAEATMDFMTQNPANASKHCKVGFDALWRMLA